MLKSHAPFLTALLFATLTGLQAQAQHALQPIAPERVGMSLTGLQAVTDMLQRHIDAGHIPGVVAAVARDNGLVYFEALGFIDLEAGAPMPENARFRIYSMTRQITSAAVLQQYERGRFEFDHATILGKLVVLQSDGGTGTGPLLN